MIMAESERQKKIKNKKQIDDITKEINDSAELLKRNISEPKMAVMIGLRQRHINLGIMYDELIDNLKIDIEELKIIDDSGFKVLNPIFQYQIDKRWLEIQCINNKNKLEKQKAGLEQLEKDVEEVKVQIEEQNARIKSRRLVLIEELKKLEVDTSDFEKPNYFG